MNNDGATIFVLDSDPSFRERICKIAQSVGMRGVPFATSQEFLNSTPENRPNCIIANSQLRGMGGLALQDKLAALHCDAPLIMVTDFVGDVLTAVQAIKNGAFDFIEKPINEQQLLDQIQICVEQD